jgi:hypothetical protein
MARTARTVKPSLSHDARDNLMAALNWPPPRADQLRAGAG